MEPQFCGQTGVLNRVPENEKGHSIRPSPQNQHPRQCPPKDARRMVAAPEEFIGGRTRLPSQSCTQDITPLPCHASSLLPVDSRADVMLCWVKKVSPAHASSSSAGFRMARLRASVAWHKKDEKYSSSNGSACTPMSSTFQNEQLAAAATVHTPNLVGHAPKHEPARTTAMFSTPYTVKFSSCPALVLKPRHYSALGVGGSSWIPRAGFF